MGALRARGPERSSTRDCCEIAVSVNKSFFVAYDFWFVFGQSTLAYRAHGLPRLGLPPPLALLHTPDDDS